jgi:hypothetical protein
MMDEKEMLKILNEQTCCGKMKVEGCGLNTEHQIGGIAVCLTCGWYVELKGGQLDEDDIDMYKGD